MLRRLTPGLSDKTLLSQGKSTKQILKELEGERTGALLPAEESEPK
jgi:hypothetical protein